MGLIMLHAVNAQMLRASSGGLREWVKPIGNERLIRHTESGKLNSAGLQVVQTVARGIQQLSPRIGAVVTGIRM